VKSKADYENQWLSPPRPPTPACAMCSVLFKCYIFPLKVSFHCVCP
jgi:hypothetical protein